jgi:hypothetical protein
LYDQTYLFQSWRREQGEDVSAAEHLWCRTPDSVGVLSCCEATVFAHSFLDKMAPRHFTRFLILGVILVFGLVIFTSTSTTSKTPFIDVLQYPEAIRDKLPNLSIPSGLHWSFQSSAHRPPEQANSTHGGASWIGDFKWLNPFSSSVTLDQDRVVLPPLAERPPIYTFYDASSSRDDEAKKIDRGLLLTWRRAWWAQGFRPVVLTDAEAMSHPLYQSLHTKGMPAALEQDFHQWLAWAHMGSGLFGSYLCLPMASYDDELLSFLRRGRFTQLIRFKDFRSGLFAGEKTQIEDALKAALDDVKLSTHTSILDAIDSERFKTESPTALANYDGKTIGAKYPILQELMGQNPIKGQHSLLELMQSHLHVTWQNTFSKGIVVLQPLPTHTFTLVKPAKDLARLLAECPKSILQSSCPPNRPRCVPCVGTKFPVTIAQSFRNTTSIFTIAVVPHPYTMIALNNLTDSIDVAHIRRNTDRDPWITAVTRDILGNARGGPSRVVSLKDAIASDYGRTRSLWFTTERFPMSFNPPPPPPKSPTNDRPVQEKIAPFPDGWMEHLDWQFGFPVPRTPISHGESLPPVPGPERWAKSPAGLPADKKKASDPVPPTDEQAAIEVKLLRQSRGTINSNDDALLRIRAVAEAWNLADTEAWKFAQSFHARQVVQRLKFEEEEAAYDTGGARGKSRWWRT